MPVDIDKEMVFPRLVFIRAGFNLGHIDVVSLEGGIRDWPFETAAVEDMPVAAETCEAEALKAG